MRSRPAKSLGVKVKPEGERRLQPVVDRFFYWLRATNLETRRLANWWADCMVATQRPLEEKMALFWHGHFATGEEKVRDYRKMEQQLALFHRQATGNFRELLVDVARDPAMLVFLDAAENVKGAPNENFAREVMELFTMGVGNYTEPDIREAARAFTGWIDDDLAFKVDPAKHDDAPKTFLGRTGNFDGIDILKIILEQKVTARIHLRQALPLLRPRRHNAFDAGAARRRAARQRLRDCAAAAHDCSCRAISTRRPRSAPASRARSSSSCRPTASSE